MARDNFNERKENRINYHESKANQKAKESQERYKAAREIGSHIPMGQPILVGHHSERRHRRDIERIDNNMRKSIEASDKATHHAEKAEHIKNDTSIYSDDPEAIEKLKARIKDLEETQEHMKLVNKAYKKYQAKGLEAIEDMGLTDAQMQRVITHDDSNSYSWDKGRVYAKFQLSNNNANIKRNRDRLARLEEQAQAETKSRKVGEIEIVENVEANRIQLIFQGKPEPEIRKILKQHGFRWSPRFGAWQRHLNANGKWAVERVIEKIST